MYRFCSNLTCLTKLVEVINNNNNPKAYYSVNYKSVMFYNTGHWEKREKMKGLQQEKMLQETHSFHFLKCLSIFSQTLLFFMQKLNDTSLRLFN